MDRPGVQQVPEGSGKQGKMEKTGCKIICGAPTTLAVKELMMMMMILVVWNLNETSLVPILAFRYVNSDCCSFHKPGGYGNGEWKQREVRGTLSREARVHEFKVIQVGTRAMLSTDTCVVVLKTCCGMMRCTSFLPAPFTFLQPSTPHPPGTHTNSSIHYMYKTHRRIHDPTNSYARAHMHRHR